MDEPANSDGLVPIGLDMTRRELLEVAVVTGGAAAAIANAILHATGASPNCQSPDKLP